MYFKLCFLFIPYFIPVMQHWIFSITTPVFSVTWSCRNHSKLLICCSRNISYYYQYRTLCNNFVETVYVYTFPFSATNADSRKVQLHGLLDQWQETMLYATPSSSCGNRCCKIGINEDYTESRERIIILLKVCTHGCSHGLIQRKCLVEDALNIHCQPVFCIYYMAGWLNHSVTSCVSCLCKCQTLTFP